MYDTLILGEGIPSFYTRLGGKNYLKKRLYKLFPDEVTYTTYVEPFFGAGWLFFYKDKSPKEVINDLEKDIYYALKDIQSVSKEQLQNMDWTPSKERFMALRESSPKKPLDRLYRFLYLTYASFSGNRRTYNAVMATRLGTRRNTLMKRFDKIQDRLQGVTILNQDYSKVIKKYDSPSSFFYLDPPYLDVAVRDYTHKTIDIPALASQLRGLKGRFLLSYNDNPEIRKAFQGFTIRNVETIYKSGGVHRTAKELVITNY